MKTAKREVLKAFKALASLIIHNTHSKSVRKYAKEWLKRFRTEG